MAVFKFGKSEDEKILEKRSRISMNKSNIDRTVRQYERLKIKSVDDAKLALKDNNMRKAKLFASFITSLDSSIKGLKDYKLLLESVDLNLQYSKTQKDIWSGLKQSSQDLVGSQLSEKQIADISQSIDSIVDAQEKIQDSLGDQLDSIKAAVEQSADINESSRDVTLKELTDELKGETKTTVESEEDKRLNELLRGINGEKEGEK